MIAQSVRLPLRINDSDNDMDATRDGRCLRPISEP
jgi:hypothetical protein